MILCTFILPLVPLFKPKEITKSLDGASLMMMCGLVSSDIGLAYEMCISACC